MPVTTTFLGELQQLVSLHGYWVIGLIVGLESLGLPLPGETILVLAAIYAATEPSFNIWLVIAVAVFGAIMGDNIGYWLGSRYGYALLLRYGERIGLLEARGQGCVPWPLRRVIAYIGGIPRWIESDAVARISDGQCYWRRHLGCRVRSWWLHVW